MVPASYDGGKAKSLGWVIDSPSDRGNRKRSESGLVSATENCSLCFTQARPFAERDERAYFQCSLCELVFVPRRFHPTAEEERTRYLEHQNTPETPGYRAFLSRLYLPLSARLAPCARGLDYGCGPGPVLASMFEEAGFPMRVYDPIFFTQPEVLSLQYDFVTCTEAVEHFHFPEREFSRLDGILKPGGWLGIMTQMLRDWSEFPKWYYPRDPTHVCFYSRRTMEWLGARWNWDCDFPSDSVTIFRKRSG